MLRAARHGCRLSDDILRRCRLSRRRPLPQESNPIGIIMAREAGRIPIG
jgi:hypothetical protein